ncbi:hypothetical protein BROUX41_001696 [Berkeleyomyces rouxiae]|uniref:uncharacterized protein n=1 Tax=Berkeleyomyces rouxiae TaxID=2035830 RepID=UPI003B774943
MHALRTHPLHRVPGPFASQRGIPILLYQIRSTSTHAIQRPISPEPNPDSGVNPAAKSTTPPAGKTTPRSKNQKPRQGPPHSIPTVFAPDNQPGFRVLSSMLSKSDHERYKSAFIPTPQLRGGRSTTPHPDQLPSTKKASRKKKNAPNAREAQNDVASKTQNRNSDAHVSLIGSKALEKPYAVPSQASGGVPDATAEYLAQAALEPQILSSPRPILVVLDLNGTLLWRPNRRNPTTFIERQHTRMFLNYLINNFVVAVWSSARPDNVNHMVNHLFPKEERRCLVAVWGRDKFGLSKNDYSSRVQVYKRLTRVWTDPAIQKASEDSQPWDQTNTVLVDDSSEKARSEPHNSILIPEFSGVLETSHILPQVHDYLNTLAFQKDVSAYIHKHPFKQDQSFTL